MKITGIIWLEDIVEKLRRKHGVREHEVTEVLNNRPQREMNENKSSISKARSYQEIGAFWDTHDVTEFEDELAPVAFDVALESERRYYPIARELALEIATIAQEHGVSEETLLNLWVQEKISQTRTPQKP